MIITTMGVKKGNTYYQDRRKERLDPILLKVQLQWTRNLQSTLAQPWEGQGLHIRVPDGHHQNWRIRRLQTNSS